MDKAKTFKAQDQIEGKKTAENSAFANSQSKSTNWVNGETLCVIFKCLSYNNVKDRKWRQKKEFPCYQDGPYAVIVNMGLLLSAVEEIERPLRDGIVPGRRRGTDVAGELANEGIPVLPPPAFHLPAIL